ncbi:AtzE family amidohydrolase [Methylobacterium oryzae CBMB20]
MSATGSPTAATIAAAIAHGRTTAREVVTAALDRIGRLDGRVGAFTDVLSARALARADAQDAARRDGASPGPLAGVPFAVKNLIDVAGLPTRAGSKINRERPPAERDGALVRRLEAAGAILVGALNMGEYAYDFTGENIHDGDAHNPHALDHMTGGSSGGSGAAIAAGMVPLTLGSDTNGSIRVPAAFCGCYGLKPTYGRLSRAGSFPFVGSLDHLGPMARSVTDLALAYDAMQGPDPDDPVATLRPAEPVLPHLDAGLDGLRVAVAGGHFARNGDPEAFAAVARAAEVRSARAAQGRAAGGAPRPRGRLPDHRGAEGATLHLDRLRTRPQDFDPAVRDRLIAGAMIPAPHVERAQRFRRWYRARVLELFETVDVILAPATPCRAPRGGQTHFVLDGVTLPVRANIGVFTQPISFIGLPVVAAPIRLDAGLPLGVQIIAAPWREDLVLRAARHLERTGVSAAPIAEFDR